LSLSIADAAADGSTKGAASFDATDFNAASGNITIVDDAHAHTTTSLSSIDISDDTNLAAGNALTLTDDSMAFDGGASPAGELGNTWASPTVDATHSGSAHHAVAAPGGSDTNPQYNNGAAFGGMEGINWTDATNVMSGLATAGVNWEDLGHWSFPGLSDCTTETGTTQGCVDIDDNTLHVAGVAVGGGGTHPVEAGDYAAASIDGDDVNSNLAGRSLTLTAGSPDTLDADTELYTRRKNFSLEDPVAADDAIIQLRIGEDVTFTEIYCSTDTGTATISFDHRATTTPNTAGTSIMSANLACDTGGETTTSFNDATVAETRVINLDIASVASSPTVVRGHLKFTVDD